jgi:hypothetical protein
MRLRGRLTPTACSLWAWPSRLNSQPVAPHWFRNARNVSAAAGREHAKSALWLPAAHVRRAHNALHNVPANSWHRRPLGRAVLASRRLAAPSSSRLVESLPLGPAMVVRDGRAALLLSSLGLPSQRSPEHKAPHRWPENAIHSNAPPSFTSSGPTGTTPWAWGGAVTLANLRA